MAGTRKAKYTEQMPFVSTKAQKQAVLDLAGREGLSQADVIRNAVDAYFGMDDGEWPTGPDGQPVKGRV